MYPKNRFWNSIYSTIRLKKKRWLRCTSRQLRVRVYRLIAIDTVRIMFNHQFYDLIIRTKSHRQVKEAYA